MTRQMMGGVRAAAMMLAVSCSVWLAAAPVWAGLTAAAKCEALKNKEAGKYAFCLEMAQMKLVKTRGTCSATTTTTCYRDDECPTGETCTKDTAKYDTLVGKCDTKLSDDWSKWESGSCPTTGDEASVQSYLSDHSSRIATALVGEVPLGDPPLKTGQMTSYGPASDGNLQNGSSRSYTDNGDGTITDNRTGLMWEKKSYDGSIHALTNTYTWGETSPPYTMDGTVVTTFLGTLNNRCADETTECSTNGDADCTGIGTGKCGFAGHRDWRIPNVNELQSLVDYEPATPAIDPAFNNGCTSGCTVLTCSCTLSTYYCSSTTYQVSPNYAWDVSFADGTVYANSSKSSSLHARGVRGGS